MESDVRRAMPPGGSLSLMGGLSLSSRKKILVLPSFFPTAEHPWRGIFFVEQAALAGERFDVRMLNIDCIRVARRRPIEWFHQFLAPRTADVVAEDAAYDVQIYRACFRLALMTERQYFSAWKNALIRSFRNFCASGWVPDLIHAHCAVKAGIAARELQKAFRIPYVITEQQHIIFQYFTNDQWEHAKHVYEDAQQIAVASEFEKQMLAMNGVSRQPLIVGNLVDETRFTVKSKMRSAAPFGILFVGLASRLKDFPTFFGALSVLKERGFAFRAIIVAPPFPDIDIDEFPDQIARLGLNEHVIFKRYASRAEMVTLIHSADVLVSTSVAETFGIAICEALMCGCPVVVTKSGGVSDFVRDGENGYEVPIRNSDALAARISDVIGGKLSMNIAAIRESVRTKFGRDAFLASICKLYTDHPVAERMLPRKRRNSLDSI
jgi:glycosyltransferase involved in cell wall biosynthesis